MGLIIWSANLIVIYGIAPLTGVVAEHLVHHRSEGVWALTYAAILVFGAAWLGSSFLESPAIATSIGIGVPIVLLIVLSVLQYYTGNDAFELGWWYNAICAMLGVACFIAGTVYYLRRIEP